MYIDKIQLWEIELEIWEGIIGREVRCLPIVGLKDKPAMIANTCIQSLNLYFEVLLSSLSLKSLKNTQAQT